MSDDASKAKKRRGPKTARGEWDPDRLRIARTHAGLTQEQLADQLGVTRVSLGRWETGASPPRVDKLVLLERFIAQQSGTSGEAVEHTEEIAIIDDLIGRNRELTRALLDQSDVLHSLKKRLVRGGGSLSGG